MLTPEQLAEIRRCIESILSTGEPHDSIQRVRELMQLMVADRAEIALELEIVIGSMQRFPDDQKAHEHALTALTERIK